MIIDWFTVVAQIINFLVLVFLLRVFLYRPVFEAIDRRKKEIETSIRSAKDKENEAQKILKEYETKKDLLESTEKKILDKAHAEVAKYLKEQHKRIDQEVGELRKIKIEKIDRDQEKFKKYATEKFTEIIFELSNHVVEELSGRPLEALIFGKFLNYLETELPEIKTQVSEGCRVALSTAFQLSPEQENDFKAVADGILKNPKYEFVIHKDNLVGVNVLVDTYELSWNASTAFSFLENNILESIKRISSKC